MVKMKGRKKPFPGSSAVLRTESQASENAPDNPETIPEVERLLLWISPKIVGKMGMKCV